MPPSAQLTSFSERFQEKNRSRTAADLPLACGGEGATGPPRGAYVHVPFCGHKCHYCGFYSVVDTRNRQRAFVDRLIEEIRAAAPYLGLPLETIFVGGGTPTLLATGLWRDLLQAAADHLPQQAEAEFTVEANPETLTDGLLGILAEGGVNRISIGAQSFHPEHLKTLQRRHDPGSVPRSVRLARSAGIQNINLDLIFAIPGETLDGWLADLDAALALEPSHLSCYALTYEPNTALTAKMRAGQIHRVEEGLEAAMYEATIDRLADADYEHYEISNWARPGYRCRHNMRYWTNRAWWPLGPGAAGHIGGIRWKNVASLSDYLRVCPLPPITDVEQLDEDGRVGEELMLRLRLIEGIELDRLDDLLAMGQRGPERAAAIERYMDQGLLQRDGERLRLTRRGLLLADSVLADLL